MKVVLDEDEVDEDRGSHDAEHILSADGVWLRSHLTDTVQVVLVDSRQRVHQETQVEVSQLRHNDNDVGQCHVKPVQLGFVLGRIVSVDLYEPPDQFGVQLERRLELFVFELFCFLVQDSYTIFLLLVYLPVHPADPNSIQQRYFFVLDLDFQLFQFVAVVDLVPHSCILILPLIPKQQVLQFL